jgi:hypothetical protein
MNSASLFLAMIISATAAAAIPPINSNPEILALQNSLKFAKDGYPKTLANARWLPAKDRQGLLRKSQVKPFRYAYAMIVSALYDVRADQQRLSWKWLDDYECENAMACGQFLDFFDGALKAHPFRLKEPDQARARRIRERARMKAESLAKEDLTRNGICTLGAPRDKWIEMAYQLYCPPSPAAAPDQGCGALSEDPKKCSSTEAIQNLVETSSHQLLLSSSFVESFKHKGKPNCEQPWRVEVVCGGTVRREFNLECTREGAGYPADVHCREIQ